MDLHCITNGETEMIKKLTKHGNSLALVIDRGVLDLLDIDEEKLPPPNPHSSASTRKIR